MGRRWKPTKLRPSEGGKMWGPVGELLEKDPVEFTIGGAPVLATRGGVFDGRMCACGYAVCSKTGPCAPPRDDWSEPLGATPEIAGPEPFRDPDTDPTQWSVGDWVRRPIGMCYLGEYVRVVEMVEGAPYAEYGDAAGVVYRACLTRGNEGYRRVRRAGEFKVGDVVRENDSNIEYVVLSRNNLGIKVRYLNSGFVWLNHSHTLTLVRPVEADG